MYDLTTMLTTISAAAASFVAILGGFIASKLLSISGERESVEENLDTLNNNLKRLQEDNASLQSVLDEDDAKSFILENLINLMNKTDIEQCYPHNEQVSISLETLRPYWLKALALLDELRLALEKDEELNSDNIPNSLAIKYIDDDFSYPIIKNMIEKINRHSYSGVAFYPNIRIPTVNLWRKDFYNSIGDNNVKIATCKFEIEQLMKKKATLRSPKGVKLGLCIFGIFSLLCIILPLCFCPFQTDNYKCFLACKIVFIIVFAIGLLSTFLYLVYLLKWKKNRNNKLK